MFLSLPRDIFQSYTMKKTIALLWASCLCLISGALRAECINSFDVPDFNFPEDIVAVAQQKLDSALQVGDGSCAVRALTQMCLAQASVSDHAVNAILHRIDSVVALPQLTPDYVSLLTVLEAQVLGGLRRKSANDDRSEDISQWGWRKQDSLKQTYVNRLARIVSNERSALMKPIGHYADIVSLGDAWGRRKEPLLYDYLMHQIFRLGFWDSSRVERKKWLSLHVDDEDILPLLHIRRFYLHTSLPKLYRKYKNNEDIGFVLSCYEPNCKEKKGLSIYEDFLKRYPDSPYRGYALSQIAQWKRRSVDVSYPDILSTADSVHVDMIFMGTLDSCRVSLYRIPDSICLPERGIWTARRVNRATYNQNAKTDMKPKVLLSQLPLVSSQTVHRSKQSDVKFSPLSFGRYYIGVSFDTPHGLLQKEELTLEELSEHCLCVSDLRSFWLSYDMGNKLIVVDALQGAPVSGVQIEAYRHEGDSIPVLLSTDAEGVVEADTLPARYCVRWQQDRFMPSTHCWGGGMSKDTVVRAQIYTDLAIYRPGEKVQSSAVLYRSSRTERCPLGSVQVRMELWNAQYRKIAEQKLTTDEMGQVTADFELPREGMNGRYSLNLNCEDGGYIASRYLEVSEYKAPSFSIDLSQTTPRIAKGERIVVKGKVSSFTGMPLADTEVQCVLQNQQWWMGKKCRYEFVARTKDDGSFEYRCPKSWSEFTIWSRIFSRRARSSYGYCRFLLTAKCTDQAGETQEASMSLSRGYVRSISMDTTDLRLSADGSLRLPVHFESSNQEETHAKCSYVLLNKKNKRVARGSFDTSSPILNWQKVPSGQYRLKIEMNRPASESMINQQVTIYRAEDSVCPVESAVWMPVHERSITPDGKARIMIGVTRECNLYYEAETRTGKAGHGWLHYAPGLHWFEMEMPQGRDEYLEIFFLGSMGKDMIREQVHFDSPVKDGMTLTAVSFRDKVVPGGREHWSFQLLDQDGKPVQGRVMMELYSKALQSIRSNYWQFYAGYVPAHFNAAEGYTSRSAYENLTYPSSYSAKRIIVRDNMLNLYGQQFFRTPTKNARPALSGPNVVQGYVCDDQGEPIVGAAVLEEDTDNSTVTDIDGQFALALKDTMHCIAVKYVGLLPREVRPLLNGYISVVLEDDNQHLDEVMVVGYGVRNNKSEALVGRIAGLDVKRMKASNVRAAQTEEAEEMHVSSTMPAAMDALTDEAQDMDLKVRMGRVNVAMWQPVLNTDENGNLVVEVDIPEDNATWCLQGLAYGQSMSSSLYRAEVLAQRPLMVQPSLPRFLRAGDHTVLKANVQNATDSLMQVKVSVELFDPRTERVLNREVVELLLGAKATEAVSLPCEAPMAEPYIGFRVKASAPDGSGDGEQQKIPVLSNVAPVVEATPYFLTTNQTYWTGKVEGVSAARASRLTFQYCDNPTWYCVSALPSMVNQDQVTSTGLAHGLFAVSLAAHIVRSVPAATLAQNPHDLNRDQDLKSVRLQQTPWITEGERQEAQHKALVNLLDSVHNREALSQIVQKLQKMQQPDGGLCWYSCGMNAHSSYWATSEFVEVLGRLYRLGAMPESAELNQMMTKALYYMDRVNAGREQELLAKNSASELDYMEFFPYVFVRLQMIQTIGFQNQKSDSIAHTIFVRTLDAVEHDWASLSLPNRAFAAILLYRNGRVAQAERIIESLRQLAIKDPVKGMYWERLRDQTWFHPVACTAAILEAFSEIAPQAQLPSIELIRQWLLLEKQTSDWGSASMASDAVYALLYSGNDWLHSAMDAATNYKVLVNGQEQYLSAQNTLSGEIRLELPLDTRQVEVIRQGGNPAWGALYHQYISPIQDIKADSVEELSIDKELFILNDSAQWVSVPRTAEGTPALSVGQKVQVRFVVKCSKTLEYLSLVDDRPACFEPCDVTSGYCWSDGYSFRDTKDSQTNIYIDRLPEGIHQFSYECFVTNRGSFACGVATVQSHYAPQFVAHSRGFSIMVE